MAISRVYLIGGTTKAQEEGQAGMNIQDSLLPTRAGSFSAPALLRLGRGGGWEDQNFSHWDSTAQGHVTSEDLGQGGSLTILCLPRKYLGIKYFWDLLEAVRPGPKRIVIDARS